MKNFDFEPGKTNLLLLVDRCKTVDELKALWNAITPEEQKMAKPFFSRQRKRLQV